MWTLFLLVKVAASHGGGGRSTFATGSDVLGPPEISARRQVEVLQLPQNKTPGVKGFIEGGGGNLM